MRLVLNPCFRMMQGDIPILYSSLRARQRASSKAVFPDPTGLSISPGSCLVAKQYSCPRPLQRRSRRNNSPTDTYRKSPLCPISS